MAQVTLTFNPVTPTPTGYRLRYRVKDTLGAYTTVSSSTPSFTITGLPNSTIYEYILDTNCGSGVFSAGVSGEFDTGNTNIDTGSINALFSWGGGGTVTVQNTDTNDDYIINVVDTSGTISVPLGNYTLSSISDFACPNPLHSSVTPTIGTNFELSSDSLYFDITVDCV